MRKSSGENVMNEVTEAELTAHLPSMTEIGERTRLGQKSGHHCRVEGIDLTGRPFD